ncbi:Zinc finger protein OZF [Gracilariopsis chorda]|uniref:Zinc finger protein OZF n=1 Tax=Gracilariopsis chorda TaxID=448386 RepID=A0A2V3IPQ4_9FLOR|nr:Zinc finger protein OZF [Gracilariopsis chorda]|eukprot:PXF43110.1 Zinc finger protein OZF [Gracilariopsis chorda]
MFTTFTIFVAALALFTTPSVAKSCITPTPTPGLSPSPSPSKAPEWYIGRYFYHSSDAPIASVLNKQTKFISLTNTVISMLDNVERTIRFEQLYRLNAQNDENIQLRKPQICNLEDGQWAVSAQQQIALRGYTEKPVVSCVTDFIESDDNEETRQYEHIYEIARIIRDNAPRIAKAANTNFSNPDAIFDWPYNTKTEDCTINVLGAYRIQRDWLLNIGITNEKKENYTAEFSRHYINEGIGRDGKVGRMKLFKRPDNDAKNQTHVLIEGATTMMVSHNGIAAPAVIKPIPFEENLAVRRALDKADLYSQQVTDATSPSSIAILVLPLFLNLIPIALLADVSTRSTFLYALLSDVLTVIPLSIKGIELISIGSATFIGSVVRISSTSDGSESEAAAAEIPGMAERPNHTHMFDRLSAMYKRHMLDPHVAHWLLTRRSPADFRALNPNTAFVLSVRPHHHSLTNPHSHHKPPTPFPKSDDLIFVDHTHLNFVLGHIWGDLTSDAHPYSSLSDLTATTAWPHASVRCRKFATDTSRPYTIEYVEYVWFDDDRAIVILSLTTFEPAQPVRHYSEVVYYRPIPIHSQLILSQRPQLVLRLTREEICANCQARLCHCPNVAAPHQQPSTPTTTTTVTRPPIDDTATDDADHTDDEHISSSQPLDHVTASWKRALRTAYNGRRRGTLTILNATSSGAPESHSTYHLRARHGRRIAPRIQLQLLSRMPRTPPPLAVPTPAAPPLALPTPPAPPPSFQLTALAATAPISAPQATCTPNCDCPAERMPDTSLARILNSRHDSQTRRNDKAHNATDNPTAATACFDASPDSTRAALTPALPSPLPPPLPLPMSEPLAKRPRTEPLRADSLLFSLDSWSPTFADDGCGATRGPSLQGTLPAAERPFSALTRAMTPGRSPSPLPLLSAFGKTPSPPAPFPLTNCSNVFQRFPPTPHIDLPSPFDILGNHNGGEAVSLTARNTLPSALPTTADAFGTVVRNGALGSTKLECSPLTVPSFNIVDASPMPEALNVQFRASSAGSTVETTRATNASVGQHENAQAARSGVQCEICGALFGKRGNKQRHIQTVHKRVKKFVCDICGAAFGLKADLNRHRVRMHESRAFCCNKCGKSFAQQVQLDQHIRVTHEQDNRPWKCGICSLRLGRKSSLTRHEQTVHQKTRFPCRICQKSYSQRFDAVRHERRAHGVVHETGDTSLRRA